MFTDFLFLLFAGLAFFFGLGVIIARNPMHSAISLVVTLLSLAGLFLLLYAEFLAWILIIVYTGAVMVLIIFVISLLNLEKDEPLSLSFFRKWGFAFIGIFVPIVIFYIYADFGFVSPQKLPIPDGLEWGSVKTLAMDLFTRYLLPFELASVLLTAAVIGAVVIARKEPVDREDMSE
ncbi:NADH-quinone oxidoreductase subunit J [bacterium]|nr:NADH-quinone oxidoreductase subunit J [bacterium]